MSRDEQLSLQELAADVATIKDALIGNKDMGRMGWIAEVQELKADVKKIQIIFLIASGVGMALTSLWAIGKDLFPLLHRSAS